MLAVVFPVLVIGQRLVDEAFQLGFRHGHLKPTHRHLFSKFLAYARVIVVSVL
jgi:hypothetical protein